MVADRGLSLLTMSSLRTPIGLALSLVLLFSFISLAAAETCTFEKGICPQWVSTNCSREACFEARKVASMKLGPAFDHTLKTADGWSAYASRGTSRLGFRRAELSRKVQGPFCFTAWYHQSGTQATKAEFIADHKFKLRKLFYSTQPNMAGRWQRVRYSEKIAEEFEIIIRYNMISHSERAMFALDDLSLQSGECNGTLDGSCDFDWGDNCGYDLGNNGSGWWLLQGQSRGKFFSEDYSTNTDIGGLVYLEKKGDNTTGVLTSPKQSGRAGTQCLEFHYYIPASFGDTQTEYRLDVAIQGPKARKGWTWFSRDLLKGSWTAADMAFIQKEDFRVAFQCTMRGRGIFRSYCAIDAIKLRECQGKRAQNDSLCNFEDGWCTWRNLDSGAYRPLWLLGGGNLKTTLARPTNDHTFGNTTGSYVFFSNFEHKAGDTAELISNMLSSSNRMTQCAEFWYIISGDQATELKVLARNPSEVSRTNPPLWTQKSGTSSQWQQGRIDVPERTQVVFRAKVGATSTPGFVALDDISIVPQDRCETLPKGIQDRSATEMLSCDFGDWNFCRWSSSGASRRFWFGVDRFSTLGPASYPDIKKGDVVSVTGEYLASHRGAVTFQSPNVGPQSGVACFSVWYHMFAGRGARLRVTLVKSPSPGGLRKLLPLVFKLGRTTTDRWYNVRRTVSLDSVHNKMTIAVTNLPHLRKDVVVALGPLNLTMGKCDVLTDGLGYCDFEFGTCGWTAGSSWKIRMTGASFLGVDAFSGPLNSVYTMTATKDNAPPDGALLTSPEWSGQSQPQCLEFWYQYGGKNARSLQVEVKANGKSEVVWEMPPYSTGKYWMLARAQIIQENKFQVVFRAKFADGTIQFVSLDDVVLRPEPCAHPVECNFIDGLCGYVNQLHGNFRWLVGTGRYEQPRSQPPVPRAKDSPPFAYLDLTTGISDPKDPSVNRTSRTSDTVGLLSPLFDASNDNTQLSVQYYRRGPDITSANLSVSCYGKTSDEVQTEVQSSLVMAEVSQWTTLNVTVKRGASCQLAVKVALGQGTNGTMAIGSVQVTLSESAVEPNQTSDSPTRCTFEDGTMCGWNLDGLSKQWFLNDPSKKLPEFPRSDHTLKAYKGRFVYAKHDVDYDYGTAVFKSPELDVDGTHGACLSFWLFAVHAHHVGLTVWSGIDRLYAASAPSSHQWEHVLVNFKRSEGKFQLWISFFMKQALVALDDIEVTPGYCRQRDFCSWEEDSSCPVMHAPDRFATWKIRTGSEIGLPDHTLKNLTGRYLYLNTTAVDSHHPVSRVFMWSRPPTESTCVTFWFSGYGALGRLNVYRFTKETVLRDPLASVPTPLRDGQWLARRVRISSRNRWNLVFEGVATAGGNMASGIMIDDIEFSDGECPTYEYCTFEDDCLPWFVKTNGNGASFEVERAGSFDKLPRDHTTQTEDGYYLLFKSPGTKGNKTSFTLLEPLRYNCVSFWYFLPKLSNGVVLYAQDEAIFNGSGVWKRYQWRESILWADTITAVSGTNVAGFVAIDDVLISEQCNQRARSTQRFDCGNQTVTTERVCDFVIDCDNGDDERNCGDCDFSEGLCGWNYDGPLNRGTTAWRRKAVGEVENSPLTNSRNSRNGYYLLLHSNATRRTRRVMRASIESPVIRNTNKLCTLTFWYTYILNGTNMDIDLKMRAGGYDMSVWTLSALSVTPQEGTWNVEVIEIGRYPSEISLSFSGVHYIPRRSMFAVDEIEYSDCALPAKQENCSEVEFRCANGACVMGYDRCNYVDDCGDSSDEQNCGDYRLSCNFDSSFCDWVPQAPKDKKEKTWRLMRPSAFLLHSPTRDHTTGTPNGLFIIVRSPTTTNATIIGPTLDNSTLCAVTFFYAMQGQSEPLLKLAFRTTRDGPWITAWSQQIPSDFFHFVGLSIPFPRKAPYQVAFIGQHRIPGKQGYIAIDDVHFWESCKAKMTPLPETPVPTTPPFTCDAKEFQCTGIKECIAMSKVCDFKEDCSNGADESRCGSGAFTTDLCGLKNEDSGARFGWNWTTVEDGKKKQGFPTTDSQSNVQGAYAAYSLLNPGVPPDQMKGLATPPLGQIAHSCVVIFYAYLPSTPTAWLMFGVRPPPVNNQQRSLTLLGAFRGTQGKGQWRKLYAKVGNWGAGARFVYMANTPGVSIDQPEYNMCHPDAQSEGREAAEKVSCTFTNPSNCGWFPENQVADTKWVLYSGGSGYPELEWQPSDSDSHKGAYMLARNMLSGFRIAHLVSVKMSPTPDTGRCFTFWYNMWHPNIGYLNLLQLVGNASTSLLWTRSGPQGKEWKQGQVQLHSEDPHQLVFEAKLRPRIPGMIAIDNFVLNDNRCSSDKSGACNFEWQSCDWLLHNWERTSGSSSVLPTIDQSTMSPSGSYALVKAPGGRMVSPRGWYDATQKKCLRFWFFLSGTRAEMLNVTRLINQGQEESLWLGTTFSAKSRAWYQASVNLDIYNETPTIVFDATTSGDPGTAVAVDDITLGNVPCPSPGSCSFEEDMCNWFNSKGLTNPQWYRHRGATVSNSSGVQKDHTLGTTDGYYLLLDAGDLAEAPAGTVQSQNLRLGPSACFKLYYFMRKDSGASFTVAIFDNTGGLAGRPQIVQATELSQWTLLSIERSDLPQDFSPGPRSTKGSLLMPSPSKCLYPTAQVVITGQTARGRSDVAIDDIDVRRGKCEGTPLTTKAPAPETTTPDQTTTPAVSQPVSTQETTSTESTTSVQTTTPAVSQPVSTQETTSAEPPPVTTEVVTLEPKTSESPAPPQPKPAFVCLRGEFSCRDGSTCIPAALLCDGINDCPNGLDEKCGSTMSCKENEFFCVTRSASACLPRSLLCDGHEDCAGGSDESLCRACPPYFCLNGATCRWTPQAPSPTCDCRQGYEGRRCNLLASSRPDADSLTGKDTRSAAGIVTGIIVVLAIILIAAVATVIVIRRRRDAQNSPVFLENPSYDASTDETSIFN